ncbi:helix-turn-helix domain-containing protein [Eisenbergiella tayi]|uniref:helix-turn-helix domain-containing protein n=1 Tax=Eisenbergiella tayi TaxID=1432052 RepID=UPI0009C032EA|nr:helix-turn-helix domain-containing protein [Eisenbergiella tayi]
MRFNTSNYRVITGKKGISDEEIRKSTGLSEKTFLWILENQYIEVQTLELIADAVGCTVAELSLPDSTMCNENCIEWHKDQVQATLTLSQRRTISRVEKLAATRPEECQIIARNPDGSVYAHIPVSWIRINPKRELTEEQREEMAGRLSQR